MMKKIPISELKQLKPQQIEKNPENPRLLFDDKELQELKTSIKEVGILVPLIVFEKAGKKNKYILLDGERRLKCAKELDLPVVPVNIIRTPTAIENIIRMFNIHKVRKEWELVPTALKLGRLIKLLPGKHSDKDLARITGMSAIRVSECRRILMFDQKYINMALSAHPSERIRGEFFSQLRLVLDKTKSYPTISRKYSENKITDIMIRKTDDGTIKSHVDDFKLLGRTLLSSRKGVPKKQISENFVRFLESKPKRDSRGKITKPAMTVREVYDRTAKYAHTESRMIRILEELDSLLDNFQLKESKNKKELIKILRKVNSKINKLLR